MISLPWRAIDYSVDFFVEPSTRFELVTPSLPRTCSTPELRGPFQGRSQKAEGRSKTPAVGLRPSAFCPLPSAFCLLERETGFEPATNSLEGCDSTPELLPPLKAAG